MVKIINPRTTVLMMVLLAGIGVATARADVIESKDEANVQVNAEALPDRFDSPDGNIQAFDDIKQAIQDFAAASGQSVTASDIVSFLSANDQQVSTEGVDADINFGPEYVFNRIGDMVSAAALSPTSFVLVYYYWIDDEAIAVIGNVSGSTITFGSEYVFNIGETFDISVAALSSNKFVVAYLDHYLYQGYGTAVIGSVSGSTITFGSEYVFNSDPPYTISTYYISVAALSSSNFVKI